MSDARAVLAGIPGFETARLGARLSNGPTNASYRVTRGDEHFVLRVDKPEAARLGLDRTAERTVVGALAAAGLAENFLDIEAPPGVTLRRLVAGRAWSREEVRRPENLARLARVLRAVHDLPVVGPRFDPLGAARRYAAQVGTRQARECLDAVTAAHASIEPGALRLCHNDPVCGNILEGEGGPLLIDWEYAGAGDAYFDLAVVVQHHGVAAPAAREFLQAWLGRTPRAAEAERLERQSRLYRHLLALWNLRIAGPAG